MRLRLLMRRLTVSAPRMAVRSAMPWPLRWALAALVAGFCGALALWAFEQGKVFAGLDVGAQAQREGLQLETQRLRAELDRRTAERDRAEAVAHTAQTRQTTEQSTSAQLQAQNKALQAENQQLREDLAFFEQMLPAAGLKPGEALAIRALQGAWEAPTRLRWRVLLMQSARNPSPLGAKLELIAQGQQGGRAWLTPVTGSPFGVTVTQYARLEGVYTAPAGVRIKSIQARLLRDGQVQAQASVTLSAP